MKKIKILILSLFFFTPYITYTQDLINKGSDITTDSSITSGGSTVKSHIEKYGILPNGDEFSCGVNFGETNQIYTISQQSDLIYYVSYFDTSYLKIKTQGYYRLVYINTQVGYCWKKDLVWNVFDINGYLYSINYYNKGELINTPELKVAVLK